MSNIQKEAGYKKDLISGVLKGTKGTVENNYLKARRMALHAGKESGVAMSKAKREGAEKAKAFHESASKRARNVGSLSRQDSKQSMTGLANIGKRVKEGLSQYPKRGYEAA